jgi:predicted site-specific integrase-resolvase
MARRFNSATWLSHAAAAEVIECSVHTVEHYVANGTIEHRERRGGRPSLARCSVEQFAQAWRERQELRARAAQARAAKRRNQPPNVDEVWVDTETFAAMLGCTQFWVTRLASEGRVPATKSGGGRWWYRRDDAERYAAARVFMRRQACAPLRERVAASQAA